MNNIIKIVICLGVQLITSLESTLALAVPVLYVNDTTNTKTYFISDGKSNTMALNPIETRGLSVMQTTAYSTYGHQNQPLSNNVNLSFTYDGEYQDPSTNLVYLRARDYDSTLQRFSTMDSYHVWNKYNFADANPIMNIDPSGHQSEDGGEDQPDNTPLWWVIAVPCIILTVALVTSVCPDLISGVISGVGSAMARGASMISRSSSVMARAARVHISTISRSVSRLISLLRGVAASGEADAGLRGVAASGEADAGAAKVRFADFTDVRIGKRPPKIDVFQRPLRELQRTARKVSEIWPNRRGKYYYNALKIMRPLDRAAFLKDLSKEESRGLRFRQYIRAPAGPSPLGDLLWDMY